jgi:hypothetical protein
VITPRPQLASGERTPVPIVHEAGWALEPVWTQRLEEKSSFPPPGIERRRRWEDGIIMDLREIGVGGVDWIRLSQDRDRWRAVVSAVKNLRVLAPRS